MDALPVHSSELDSFIDFLYKGIEGYVYLAASDRSEENDWKQQFFIYPEEVDKLKSTIKTASKSHEVYIGPALYKTDKNSLRSNIKISNVVWTEFDGNAPEWTEANEPSYIIQSSSELNQHVYWRLNEPVSDVNALEDVNRRITFNMGADSSAWDATQVLRPPETWNYKRDTPVGTMFAQGAVYDIEVFNQLAPAPEALDLDWELTVLPSVDDVILKYSFTPDMVRLLKADKSDIKDRSESLMNLAYGCAQMGLTNNELMCILVLADDRWEKFKGRKDRMKRLAHIITIARNKYPDYEEGDDGLPFTLAYGFQEFLNTDIEVNWVIEPMLMEQGSMLMVGPSGVGKTQMALQIMIHAAIGEDYLHYKMLGNPKKILFLSLEMGHGELKVFVEAMAGALTDPQKELLEQNFILVPHGEPWFLNTLEGQNQLIQLIEEFEPDGILVDSIGSAVTGNISSDDTIQPYTQFNDRIRKKYGVFWFAIHHMRKAGDGQPDQDDVYGNQYLLNRSTSTYAMLRAKNDTIRIKNFKNRLAAREDDFYVTRDENLVFHDANDSITEKIEKSDIQNLNETANGIPL